MPTESAVLDAIADRTETYSSSREDFTAGATVHDGGLTAFRFWAPAAASVRLACEGAANEPTMERREDGWHTVTTGTAPAGTRYWYRLPDGTRVPDPAARFQPDGVHGPSEVVDHGAYRWQDARWRSRPWSEAIVYELHVGTFTAQGTFRSAIGKLDHLRDLGVTCIDLMPVAHFPGQWNWGYDGVFLYSPASIYGRPDDLKALVDEAHRREMMVMLDVVYNHFGPDGNLLTRYAPQVFTDHHHTPWGDAVNFDGDGSAAVRDFMIQNALYWIREYHVDGLRLDAVHAILDDSPKHLLTELAERVRAASAPSRIHLVIENESNEARRLARSTKGAAVEFTAQWNDDLHHVLHTALTDEDESYYVDFRDDTAKLARALSQGFAFQGETMRSSGRPRGEDARDLPPSAFVSFLQNHDQIGNRALGERIGALASDRAVKAAASVYLLLPQVPMLFMGEEWAATTPFPFFCDFEGETGEAVRKGRREEFAEFEAFKDPERRAAIPDPQAIETFRSAKLDWRELDDERHANWLAWYRDIIAVRKRHVVPMIDRFVRCATSRILGPGAVEVRFETEDGGRCLMLVANLSQETLRGAPRLSGIAIHEHGERIDATSVGPWYVRWSLESPG